MNGLLKVFFRLGRVPLLERNLPQPEISGAAGCIFFKGFFEFGFRSHFIAGGGIGARKGHVRLGTFRGGGGKRDGTERVGFSLFVLPCRELDFRQLQAHVEIVRRERRSFANFA